MPIPAAVNICGYPYTIAKVDAIGHSDNGSFIDGQITYHDAEIAIVNKLPPQFERAIVLHEILHGMAHHMGQLELQNDEGLITALGFAVTTLLRSNPDLVAYLVEE